MERFKFDHHYKAMLLHRYIDNDISGRKNHKPD